jgi:alpha-tubulin suppressor-like RCC1 family protein
LPWFCALLAAVGVLGLADPAAASTTSVGTVLHVHAVAASVQVRTAVVVTGTVTPAASAPVVLQRLVGKKWVALSHQKPTRTGTFAFSVTAPKTAMTLPLRVVRAKVGRVRAGVSGVLKVPVVRGRFTVSATETATVPVGTPIVVSGKVTPKTTGTVLLQTLAGTTWFTFASAKLGPPSTYTLSGVQPVGAHRLRVVKAATPRTASGVSKTLTATVVGPPVVTTTSLPVGTVGQPYSTQLAASGGSPPYSWTATGLPDRLALSAAGQLSGVPTGTSATSVTVTLDDAGLVSVSATLSLQVVLPASAANTLTAWGFNSNGQLGNSSTTNASSPVLVGLTGEVSVAGTSDASVAVRYDGTVWTWGNDGTGELGDDLARRTTGSTVPVEVPGLTGVIAVSASGGSQFGSGSMYALKRDGTVWAWGRNVYGQLGDGTTTERDAPVLVTGLSSVTAIAAGDDTGYALLANGTVWTWGANFYGTLGIGSNTDSSVPVQAQGLTGVTQISAELYDVSALRSDGTVWDWGHGSAGQLGVGGTDDSNVPEQVTGLTHIVGIATGGTTGYALSASGSVYGWGNNTEGEIGDGALTVSEQLPKQATQTGVTAIAAGGSCLYATLADGTVRSWGFNGNGQLGNGSTTQSASAVAVSGLSQVLSATGAAYNGYAISAS